MKLDDLRRAAIRHQTKVRFRLSNGMECVVNEHGIAQVPELRRTAELNIETDLASTREFRIGEEAVTRDAIEKWAGPATAIQTDDHDE
jgi:hypothetical protein